MADEDDTVEDKEPNLPSVIDSEIEAVVDLGGLDDDNIYRPIMISQPNDQVFLELTLEDASRLNKFLTDAIIYVNGALQSKDITH